MNQNYDPLAAWRSMRDTYLDTWSKAMIDFVNSDAYAQATGALLDTYLAASAPFRQAVENAMSQVLAQLNMPTRAEVISLAERLTNIEIRLDDLDAKLDTLQNELQSAAKAQDSERAGQPEPPLVLPTGEAVTAAGPIAATGSDANQSGRESSEAQAGTALVTPAEAGAPEQPDMAAGSEPRSSESAGPAGPKPRRRGRNTATQEGT